MARQCLSGRTPGRGIPINYSLGYDSSVWYINGIVGQNAYWTPTRNWGWGYPNAQITGYLDVNLASVTPCPSDYTINSWSYSVTYHEPNGTSHFMGYVAYIDGGSVCPEWGTNGDQPLSGSADGFQIYYSSFSSQTGTIVNLSGATLIVPAALNGGVPASTSTSVTDSNGNEVNINPSGTIADTVGDDIFSVAGSGTPSDPYTLTYSAASGPINTTVKYASYNVRTNFGCAGIGEWQQSGVNLVSEIDLPNGTKYTFSYEPTPGYSGYVTGRLASVTLPTGTGVSYDYYGNNDGISCTDGTTLGLKRTNQDGIAWYSHTPSGDTSSTTINIPQAGSSTYNFFGEFLNQEQDYAPDSTLLRTLLNCETQPTGTPPTCSPSGPETGQYHYVLWPTGALAESYEVFATTANAYGTQVPNPYLPTEIDEYDYGSNTPGALLRKTLTTYATNLGNIINKPASVTVEDGSGNIAAQTTYTYDEGTVAPTDAPQHVSISASRGNVTTISSLVSGSTWISRSISYFDTGTVQTSHDFNGNPTTYTYTCGDAYPATVTNALSQTTTTAYDCSTGLVSSVTDPNNQPTNYAYDLTLRPMQTNYPDGGQTTKCYTDLGGPTCSQIAWPLSIVTTQKITAGQNFTTTEVLDGLGRDNQNQLNSDPDGTDYTFRYWQTPAEFCTTNPYRATSDPTYGLSCTTYDRLNRPTQMVEQDNSQVNISYSGPCATVTDEAGKKRESCTDALGRLIQVVEDPGGLNYITNYTYNALDNLIAVAQSGSHQRTFSYDSLSRLRCAANPEIQVATCPNPYNGAYTAGTIGYTYDANGNLLTKTSPAPNQQGTATVTVSYSYDALNRLTQKTYSDGTPTANFQYDATSNWGAALTNTAGRLTESWTSGSPFSATIYSYDPMGRVIVNTQCTPHVCGSGGFNLSEAYDLSGDMTSYSNGEGVTFTQSFNAAGQLTQVTSSFADSNHPAQLFGLTGPAHYSPDGSLSSVTLGNTVSESANYASRGWLQSWTTTGNVITSQATPGTGSATASGTEQSQSGSPAMPGTGSATAGGTEQSRAGTPATSGSGSVTIDGYPQSVSSWYDPCSMYDPESEDYLECTYNNPPYEVYTYDYGNISITINGVTSSTSYSSSDSSTTLASRLATAISNYNSYVWVSVSGSTISFSARTNGAATNYSLSTSSSSNDTYDFPSPSFYGTASGLTLTGGADATTIYDAGSTWITVNGQQCSASYGNGDTSSSVAGNLANAVNSCSSFVSAGVSGATVNLTAKTTGASTNYSLSSGSSSTQGFSPSFNVNVSGGSLAGGSDSTPGVYDAGNVSVTVNGVQCSTTYGNGDTSSSVASNLANAVNSCGGSPVSASVSGTTVNLVAKTGGASTNYSLSSASSSTQGFASPSFTLSVSGPNLTGGNDQGIGSGTIYSNNLTYAPNGNILTANDSANGSWTYGYDALNRLTSAQQSGQPAYTYVYDAYGNRLDDYLNGQCTAAYTSCLSFDANNHINNGAVSYDAAGNVTSDAMHFYYYDAENRLIQVDGPLGNCAAATACYKYDAVGNRTEKIAGGTIIDYIYDTSGRVIAEHDFTNGLWARGEVYADGKHIATYANGTIYFNHADWLETERVRSGLNGQASEQCANLPFGDGMNCTGGSDTSPIHFTGQEHDTESGLDNFLARYDSSGLGRFTSPDPGNFGANLNDPQSWNMYAYVQNNPLSLTDPTGMGSCNPNTPTYVCVSADGPSWAVDTEDFLIEMYHYAQTALTMQVVSYLAPTIEIANVIRHGPANPTCVDAWAVGGAGLGMLVGQAGIAADAFGEVVTVPGGGMGGTALGTAGGMIACSAASNPSGGKAQSTLDHIDNTGEAPPGYEGGKVFNNREGLLPKEDANGRAITYREWDVNPKQPGLNRGQERLVTGSDGSAYYTDDHYSSFTRIR